MRPAIESQRKKDRKDKNEHFRESDMNRSKSSAIHIPFPRTKVARDFLPHTVEPQKRNLILDTEHPTNVVSNLLVRVYSVVPRSQAFVRDETPKNCK